MPFSWIVTLLLPSTWEMEVPTTIGVELKVSACVAVVVCFVLPTAVSTSIDLAAPVSPRGITKSNTAASSVPEFVTVASVPGSPVVTVPTLMAAVNPVAPVGPVGAMLLGKWL